MRRRDDQGFFSVWTVAISISIVAVIALTIDAGRILRARSEAYGTAAAAARFGASRIDERTAVATGVVVVDPVAARQAIDEFLATEGYTDLDGFQRTITVEGLEVTVRIQHQVEARSALDLGAFDIDATATAEAVPVDPATLP